MSNNYMIFFIIDFFYFSMDSCHHVMQSYFVLEQDTTTLADLVSNICHFLSGELRFKLKNSAVFEILKIDALKTILLTCCKTAQL